MFLRGFLLVTAFLIAANADGQNQPLVLEEEAFLRLVVENHPIAKRADLQPAMGQMMVRAARGGFDPKLIADYDGKDFGGTNYYRVLEAGLQVPTWVGVKAVAGYLKTDGTYLNSSDGTPAEGLAAVGLEWTPLKGLMMDKRRASLLKAQTYALATQAERNSMLNDLLMDATESYWEWVRAWHALAIYDSALTLAQTRMTAVVAGWKAGARAAIDTVEATILVKARQLDRSNAFFKYQKAQVYLEAFLWNETQEPLEMNDTLQPPALAVLQVPEIAFYSFQTLDSLIDVHPEILLSLYKLDILDVERRLQAEQLKPELNLKYQLLANARDMDWASSYGFGWQNYKLSAGFSFPIFLREARGQLAETKLQLEAAELSLTDKRRQLMAKASAFQNGYEAAVFQTSLALEMVSNNFQLTTAEYRRFEVGESSLFMVNAREQSLFKAKLDHLGFITSLPVLGMNYHWSLGNAFLMGNN